MMFKEPMEMGMKMFQEMESFWVSQMKAMVKDPSFLSQLGNGIHAGLDGKKEFSNLARQYLEAMNMPTRDDIARILQYLQAIESRVIDLEERLEDASLLKGKDAPPRAKAPRAEEARGKSARRKS